LQAEKNATKPLLLLYLAKLYIIVYIIFFYLGVVVRDIGNKLTQRKGKARIAKAGEGKNKIK
jgi:hypothetical protein